MVGGERAGDDGDQKKTAVGLVPGTGAWEPSGRGREEIRPQVVGTTACALLLDPYGFGIEKGWKRGEAKETALVMSLALGQAQSHLIRTATLYDGGCQLWLLVSPKANLAMSGELWVWLSQLGGVGEDCAVAI